VLGFIDNDGFADGPELGLVDTEGLELGYTDIDGLVDGSELGFIVNVGLPDGLELGYIDNVGFPDGKVLGCIEIDGSVLGCLDIDGTFDLSLVGLWLGLFGFGFVVSVQIWRSSYLQPVPVAQFALTSSTVHRRPPSFSQMNDASEYFASAL